MAAEVGSAWISIVPSAKDFGKKLGAQVDPELDKAGKSGGTVFGGAFKLAAAAGAGLAAVSFLKDSIAEARESQKVAAQTAQVIKSTGGAAKVSADQVSALATAISNKSGIDDEAIQSGANLLLTFTNVRNEAGKGNDIFNQSTQIMTDMAAALGTDASGSAIQLGKALNDPIKGITALTRVGVSFTDEQKAQIKTLVLHNDTLGAQKIILGELTREFGGSAAAQATAGEKAAVAFGNLKEAVGTALLPVLDQLLSFVTTTLVPGIYTLAGFLTGTLLPAFQGIADHLRGPLASAVAGARQFLADVLTSFRNVVEFLTPVALDALKIVAVAVGVTLVTALKILGPALSLVGTIIEGVTRFLAAHKTAITVVAGVITALMLPAILTFTTALIANTAAVVLGTAAGLAIRAALVAWTAAQWLLNAALTANPIGVVIAAIALLAAGIYLAYKHSETFRAGVQTVWEWLKKFIGFTPLGALIENFDKVRAAIGWVIDKVEAVISALGRIVVPQALRDAVGLLDKAGGALGGAADFAVHPHFASGVRNFRGGLAVVGEEGPELTYLAPGTSVLPAGPTAALLAGGGVADNSRIEALLERLDARLAAMPRDYQLGMRSFGLA